MDLVEWVVMVFLLKRNKKAARLGRLSRLTKT